MKNLHKHTIGKLQPSIKCHNVRIMEFNHSLFEYKAKISWIACAQWKKRNNTMRTYKNIVFSLLCVLDLIILKKLCLWCIYRFPKNPPFINQTTEFSHFLHYRLSARLDGHGVTSHLDSVFFLVPPSFSSVTVSRAM